MVLQCFSKYLILSFRFWSSSRLEVTVVKRYQENPTRNVGKTTWKNFLLYHFCFISLLGQQLPNMWKTINFNFFEKEPSLLNFFSAAVNFTTPFLPKTLQFYPSKSHKINYKPEKPNHFAHVKIHKKTTHFVKILKNTFSLRRSFIWMVTP